MHLLGLALSILEIQQDWLSLPSLIDAIVHSWELSSYNMVEHLKDRLEQEKQKQSRISLKH